jgi:hypothetical protein
VSSSLALGADDDHRQAGQAAVRGSLELGQELEAVHVGHVDVEQDEVDVVVLGEQRSRPPGRRGVDQAYWRSMTSYILVHQLRVVDDAGPCWARRVSTEPGHRPAGGGERDGADVPRRGAPRLPAGAPRVRAAASGPGGRGPGPRPAGGLPSRPEPSRARPQGTEREPAPSATSQGGRELVLGRSRARAPPPRLRPSPGRPPPLCPPERERGIWGQGGDPYRSANPLKACVR